MSDYGDFCHEMRDRRKRIKEEIREEAHKEDGLIDRLESLGAEFKTDGVWRLGTYDAYPYKGWVRNYRTNKGYDLKKWLQKMEKENGEL